jgi:hypothetical protein
VRILAAVAAVVAVVGCAHRPPPAPPAPAPPAAAPERDLTPPGLLRILEELSPPQVDAIVAWYRIRDANDPPVVPSVWLARRNVPIRAPEFWAQARETIYAWRRDSSAIWERVDPRDAPHGLVTTTRGSITQITLTIVVIPGPIDDGDDREIAIHYYFDADDNLIGVNLH